MALLHRIHSRRLQPTPISASSKRAPAQSSNGRIRKEIKFNADQAAPYSPTATNQIALTESHGGLIRDDAEVFAVTPSRPNLFGGDQLRTTIKTHNQAQAKRQARSQCAHQHQTGGEGLVSSSVR
jgi:hypothetical protein